MAHHKYRKDIDGLRAIAVLSVIVFHLNSNYLSGGFLGVDVFFVISGYLITGLIYNELKAKTFTYKIFYARRIRRLFPALIATIILCWICAIFVLNNDRLKDFALSSFFAIFGLSNFFFYENSDYFDMAASSRPLLHTWSLAVEEQFYVFWPILLMISLKVKKHIRLAIFIVIILLSTWFAEFQIKTDPTAAFFLLPSRIAELSIGGLAFLLGKEFISIDKTPNFIPNLTFILALSIITISFVKYSEVTPFPGFYALPVAFATASLLLFPVTNWFKNILANPIMSWIGLISYSAYLIHWPVIVFYKTYKLAPLNLLEEALIFGFTIGLSSLFYLFIETPFRSKKSKPAKVNGNILSIMTLGSIGLVALLTLFTVSQKPKSPNFSSDPIEIIEANNKTARKERTKLITNGGCHVFMNAKQNPVNQTLDHCLELKRDKKNILLLGSSFGADDWVMLNHAYPEYNVQRITTQACPPFHASAPHCRETSAFILDNISRINEYDAIILSHNWNKTYTVSRSHNVLKNLVTKTILLGPRGNLNDSILDIYKKELPNKPIYIPQKYYKADLDLLKERTRRIARTYDMGFVDIHNLIREDKGLKFLVDPSSFIFLDYGHYSPQGAKYVGNKFREEFPDLETLIKRSSDPS